MNIVTEYGARGVGFVAVSPNDPLAVRLDELGYTDVGDSLDDMKRHAERRGYTFPYLYDGDTQRVSTAYGALATPHVFVFDQDRKLRYNGRIDDSEIKTPTSHDLRNALDDLLAGNAVRVPETRVFGCSTKWADKRDSAKQARARWEAEPVDLQSIDAASLKQLVANATENYRLINLWSITCAPCITELPELVTVNRMYRGRHFELYTLTIDSPDQRDAALDVLSKAKVSCKNYIYHSDDRDELAEIIDSQWRGPVPYTLLIAPGGEIVQRWSDEVDPATLKETIVGYLGRTYASKK
jgi:peroxiredoxin